MKVYSLAIILVILVITSTVNGVNPAESIAASAQEKINKTEQELQKKIAEHAVEGNLTMEHISEDVRATAQEMKEELKEQGREYVDQKINLTEEELQQKLKEEVQKQPGFVLISSLAGLLAVAYLLRK
jgi:F0F1-type ATP synthase membrane subunit b/b'